jgi:thermostable 8-oxoguanine DNA glycosylase
MELVWKLSDSDIIKVREFVKTNVNPNVEKIMNRNIRRIEVTIDKDSILRAMLTCLLASDTDSYPEHEIDKIFHKKSHFLNFEYLFKMNSIENAFHEIFQKFGNNKYVKKVPKYFSSNFDFLVETNWNLESEIKNSLKKELTKHDERKLADMADRSFKGFGSKEARSFLLALGVTKYEIPIDNKLIRWLEKFSFPIKFTKIALQDIIFYHFVSDGIQKLCEVSDIYPCVLYASIPSGSNLLKS